MDEEFRPDIAFCDGKSQLVKWFLCVHVTLNAVQLYGTRYIVLSKFVAGYLRRLRTHRSLQTLLRRPFHPRVTAEARKRPRSFYKKCRWQVTPKRAYTLDPAKSEWADYTAAKA